MDKAGNCKKAGSSFEEAINDFKAHISQSVEVKQVLESEEKKQTEM